ncbi:unnamed protein product (macronuclear) [Paramecium tetraurelia]|uniref:Transmembrane protein n=1 Tax=Paramecium tetraurelia TaxID=5888 RepID=A0CY90_PARTE|nr:uncharacterized protein GSPATT00039095001 [Paramecium tetraurelia]CAK75757.1 unnamed protein product [Paramecium tetraurelia]|eukprot:XP_001443154.1 hypothetical protein (macronuclear) [Paramecium tetraurelia strain d4-2]
MGTLVDQQSHLVLILTYNLKKQFQQISNKNKLQNLKFDFHIYYVDADFHLMDSPHSQCYFQIFVQVQNVNILTANSHTNVKREITNTIKLLKPHIFIQSHLTVINRMDNKLIKLLAHIKQQHFLPQYNLLFIHVSQLILTRRYNNQFVDMHIVKFLSQKDYQFSLNCITEL